MKDTYFKIYKNDSLTLVTPLLQNAIFYLSEELGCETSYVVNTANEQGEIPFDNLQIREFKLKKTYV